MKTADPQPLTYFHSCRNSDERLELSINDAGDDDNDDNRRNLWCRVVVHVNLPYANIYQRDALHEGVAYVTTILTAGASFWLSLVRRHGAIATGSASVGALNIRRV